MANTCLPRVFLQQLSLQHSAKGKPIEQLFPPSAPDGVSRVGLLTQTSELMKQLVQDATSYQSLRESGKERAKKPEQNSAYHQLQEQTAYCGPDIVIQTLTHLLLKNQQSRESV